MSENNDEKFTILWKLMPSKRGGATMAEIPKDFGASHAVLLTSIMKQPDGGFSCSFHGFDGGQGGGLQAMPVIELFKIWTIMAGLLAERKELPDGNRQICRELHQAIQEAVMANAQADAQEVKH